MTRGEAVNWIINISADIGKAEHSELWHYEQALSEIREMLESEPERKTGKWIAKEDRPKQEVFICSECGGWAYSPWIGSRKNPKPNRCKYTFCPNCGSYNGGKNEM